MQHEMNNNHGGYSTEKTSKKALGASTDNAPSEGKPVGPPQQVKNTKAKRSLATLAI